MDTYEQEALALLAKLQPGTSWKVDYGRGNKAARVVHIRAIVDGDRVVFRWWSYHKQTWRYAVEWLHWFWMLDSDGRLKAREE